MTHIVGVMLSRYSKIACRCLIQVLDGPGFSSGTAWDYQKSQRNTEERLHRVLVGTSSNTNMLSHVPTCWLPMFGIMRGHNGLQDHSQP